MTRRLELPKFQAFDANGDPLSGGLVYTYEVGTTTLKTTYSDYDASTANANPVVLDSRGEADIYTVGAYKIVLKDSAGATIWTLDNVQGGVGTDASGEDFYYPDYTATDQGVSGNSDTIKYAVDTISSDNSTIYLRHNSGSADTTYTLTTSESTPSNIQLKIENGAILDGAGTLTFDSPEQVIGGPKQQIFGSSITVTFTNPGTVYPGWWGVDGTADNVQVQAAENSLSGGGVVDIIQDLTFAGTVDISANISVISLNKSVITLSGSTDDDMLTVTGDNVLIDGIWADGNKAGNTSGSFLKVEEQSGSIDGLRVENCVITDFKEYGIHVANACANHTFSNNKFDSVDKSAILVAPDTNTEVTDNIRMEGNHVIAAGVNGLQVYNSTNSNNTNIFINNNYLINVVAVPIEIQRGVRGVVSYNNIEGSGTNGISVGSCQYIIVQGNVVEDQSGYGIELGDVSEGGNAIISGNAVYNCGTGIITGDAGGSHGSRLVISNNVIEATTSQEGIDCQHAAEVVITGNVIKDPKQVGIRVHGATDAVETVNDVIVSSNLIKYAAASTYGPAGISLLGVTEGRVSDNLIVTDISGSSEWVGLINVGTGCNNLSIVNNSLIGTVAIVARGIYIVEADSGTNIYIKDNLIKYMKEAIRTVIDTSPYITVLDNIIENSSSADLNVHASHKTNLKATSPTSGTLWNVGDVVWETVPTDSNPPGWICATRVKTDMRAAAVVTATTMEVDSTTGMTAGDIVGVELDNGTWHWTTVASVTDGDTFELTAGLSSDGAAIDNDVVTNLWLPLAEIGTVKV